ncbi:hypothetical protein M1B78_17975 [Bacteroides sp. KH569_7]|uniref:Uncharacterized protein n=1 Tax=Bacteroides muris (ex Fokt et al. 2023) TaxID=2937417 RepID=A0A9X2P421_9BACE|nr:hypothetical protein [Bacteroides muris (ex Fokt et al. 2023)]MCR6509982.1 hypothetical protein [Bacteroides muris (ex Fokt et al. 2023)]
MWWGRIVEWFSNIRERNELIYNFNKASKQAFIIGIAPTFLKAESSRGNSNYRHQFSSFFYHGFRIRMLAGRPLDYDEVMDIGNMLIANTELIRNLVTLGYDTLEITDIKGNVIDDWRLTALLELW